MLLRTPSCAGFLIVAGGARTQGYRVTVPGRIGQTIYDVAVMHGVSSMRRRSLTGTYAVQSLT